MNLATPAGSLVLLFALRHWRFTPPHGGADYQTTLESLRGLLREAVCFHLMRDVPLGIFLSSGLDSSTLATLSAAASDAAHTLTVGSGEYSSSDENRIAPETAPLLGVEHHLIEQDEIPVLSQIQRNRGAIDQPTPDVLNTFIRKRPANCIFPCQSRAGMIAPEQSNFGGIQHGTTATYARAVAGTG